MQNLNQTTPGGPSKKRWPLSKNATISLVLTVIILLVGAIFVATKNKDGGNNNVDTNNKSIYFEREGYNPKDYQPKIGDPFALDLATAGDIQEYKNTPIISACNVVSVEDLKKEKLYISTNSAPKSVLRTYFDGVGQAPFEASKYSLAGDTDAEGCHYFFESGGDIDIIVYQPPLTSASLIKEELADRYAVVPAINLGGADVYKRKSESSNTDRKVYMVKKDDVLLRVSSVLKDENKLRTLMQIAADNVGKLKSNPKGAPVAKYNTPTFTKSVAIACDLVTNSDIKQLTGNDAGPLVKEGLAPSTGVTQVGDKLRNFIQTECTRRNTGLGSGLIPGEAFNQHLNVVASSYQETDAAQYHMESIKKDVEGPVDMNGVGDEAYAYTDNVGENTVMVRQGRFVLELVLNRTSQKEGGLDNINKMIEKLTPFAKEAAGRLQKL